MFGPSVTFALIALILITRSVSPSSAFVSCVTKPSCPVSIISLYYSTSCCSYFRWKFGTALSCLSNSFAEMTGWLVEVSCPCIEISTVIGVAIFFTRWVLRCKHIGVWFLSFLLPIASSLKECDWISLVQHIMGDRRRASSQFSPHYVIRAIRRSIDRASLVDFVIHSWDFVLGACWLLRVEESTWVWCHCLLHSLLDWNLFVANLGIAAAASAQGLTIDWYHCGRGHIDVLHRGWHLARHVPSWLHRTFRPTLAIFSTLMVNGCNHSLTVKLFCQRLHLGKVCAL